MPTGEINLDQSNKFSAVYRVDRVIDKLFVMATRLLCTPEEQSIKVLSPDMASGNSGQYWIEEVNLVGLLGKTQVHVGLGTQLWSSTVFGTENLRFSEFPDEYANKIAKKAATKPDLFELSPTHVRHGYDAVLPEVPSYRGNHAVQVDVARRLKTGFQTLDVTQAILELTGGGLNTGDWEGSYLLLDSRSTIKTSDLIRKEEAYFSDKKSISSWEWSGSSSFLDRNNVRVFLNDPLINTAIQLDLRSNDDLLEELDKIARNVSENAWDDNEIDTDQNNQFPELKLDLASEETIKQALPRLKSRILQVQRLVDLIKASPEVAEAIDDMVLKEAENRSAQLHTLIESKISDRKSDLLTIQTDVENAERALVEVEAKRTIAEQVSSELQVRIKGFEALLDNRLTEISKQLDDRFEYLTLDANIKLSEQVVAQNNTDKKEFERPSANKEPVYNWTMADAELQREQLEGLAAYVKFGSFGLRYAIVSAANGLLPVFTGENGSNIATLLALTLNSDVNFLRTLDPTAISLSDVFNDQGLFGDQTFSELMKTARKYSTISFPVVLCAVNSSPARFWLEALQIERLRRTIPVNILFFLSLSNGYETEPFPRFLKESFVPIETLGTLTNDFDDVVGLVWPSQLNQNLPEEFGSIISELGALSPVEARYLRNMSLAAGMGDQNNNDILRCCQSHLRWLRNEFDEQDIFPDLTKDI